MEYLDHYRSTLRLQTTPQVVRAEPKPEERWKHADPGTWRIDVDTCYNEERDLYVIWGIIIENEEDRVIAFGQCIQKPLTGLEGELLAILEGLKIAKEKHFYPIRFVIDSFLTVQTVTNPSEDLVPPEFEILKFASIWTKFEPRNSYHIRRKKNMAAHYIAKFFLYPQILLFGRVRLFFVWLKSFVFDDLNQ